MPGPRQIGWLYQNGWGVKQDSSEATNWYRKAADQGNPQARINLESLFQTTSQSNKVQATAPPNPSTPAPDQDSPPAILLSNGVRAPRAIYEPDPGYSEEARKAMFSGETLLSVVVGVDGLPHDIKNLAPLGYGLDEQALDAVKTWKFEPAMKDGKPVATQIMIEVNFRLYGELGVGAVDVVGDPQTMNPRAKICVPIFPPSSSRLGNVGSRQKWIRLIPPPSTMLINRPIFDWEERTHLCR